MWDPVQYSLFPATEAEYKPEGHKAFKHIVIAFASMVNNCSLCSFMHLCYITRTHELAYVFAWQKLMRLFA